MTGCIKLQLLSLRRDAWCNNGAKWPCHLIQWRFWSYFVSNMFDTKLFSHVIIRIDHSQSVRSYGNNTLMISCLTVMALELRSQDVPVLDSKSLRCCFCNFLLSHCWPISLSPNGIPGKQWVNITAQIWHLAAYVIEAEWCLYASVN